MGMENSGVMAAGGGHTSYSLKFSDVFIFVVSFPVVE